jgi:NADPH:quinone reductase-like Zn-dependent oxidoreductase
LTIENELPEPSCPPKGLLIDVKAIGLNYAGAWDRDGPWNCQKIDTHLLGLSDSASLDPLLR